MFAPQHETALTRSQVTVEGPEDGTTLVRPEPDGCVWSKRFRGELAVSGWTPTFKSTTVELNYLLAFVIQCPGQNNDLSIAVPIRIISAPPPLRIGRGPSSEGDQVGLYDLPPSYFEVMESPDSKGG